jgi:hypothetical protein
MVPLGALARGALPGETSSEDRDAPFLVAFRVDAFLAMISENPFSPFSNHHVPMLTHIAPW